MVANSSNGMIKNPTLFRHEEGEGGEEEE